jgi:hypothetical protein
VEDFRLVEEEDFFEELGKEALMLLFFDVVDRVEEEDFDRG